jgi:hypothetical protein
MTDHAAPTASPSGVRALVFDVGGVFRFSDRAQQYALSRALRECCHDSSAPLAPHGTTTEGAWWIDTALGGERCREALWRLRGLETFNALRACVRLVLALFVPPRNSAPPRHGAASIAEWLPQVDDVDCESRLCTLMNAHERNLAREDRLGKSRRCVSWPVGCSQCCSKDLWVCVCVCASADDHHSLVDRIVTSYRAHFASADAGALIELAPNIDGALSKLSAAGYVLGR